MVKEVVEDQPSHLGQLENFSVYLQHKKLYEGPRAAKAVKTQAGVHLAEPNTVPQISLVVLASS